MKSKTSPRGQWHVRVGLITLAVLGLLIGLDSAPAAAVTKRVACRLPFVGGTPNFFCSDLHQIFFVTDGFTNNADTIIAELLAMDEQGNVLKSRPVHSGDFVWMTSSKDPNALTLTQSNNFFSLTAPLPVLRVVAIDGVTKEKMEAYCSNVAFAEVIEPKDAVVSLAENDATHVRAAIPLVDATHLQILVDGVDILALIPIPGDNPKNCTASSPCGGSATINGTLATISNLIVDSGGFNAYAANTVSFDITNLGCGGHLFTVSGVPRPGAVAPVVSAQCHKGIAAQGLSNGFAVNVTKPTDQQAGLSFPVNVEGEVCHGRPIAAFNINGKNYDTSGQTLTPGNGTTTADTYKFSFDIDVGATDVPQDVSLGNVPVGTFWPGSTRLVASATDDLGNKTFDTVIFATGTTANPGITATIESLQAQGKFAVTDEILNRLKNAINPTATQINNAFVIGLSADAVQKVFTKHCETADAQIKANVPPAIEAVSLPNKDVGAACSCDANTSFDINNVTVTGDTTCTVDFQNDKFTVSINMPTINIPITASGHCGLCVLVVGSETTVSGTATVHLANFKIKFDVEESHLLNPAGAPPTTVLVDGNVTTTGSITIDGCAFPSDFCTGFVEFLAFIGSGFDDWPDFTTFDLSSDTFVSITNSVEANKPDPIKLNDLKVAPFNVAKYDSQQEGKLTDVRITPEGIIAGLRGTFTTNTVAADAQPTPGAFVTSPNLPQPFPPGFLGAMIGISDAGINQMFASMTLAGRLKTAASAIGADCASTGKTLGDLLPANVGPVLGCDTIVDVLPANPNNDAYTRAAADAIAQGVCHGIRLNNCETLTAVDPPGTQPLGQMTAFKQGACHGTRGDNCTSLPVPGNFVKATLEKLTCGVTPNLNLRADQAFFICTRNDIPPRMVFPVAPVGTVDASLVLNSLSVVVALDKTGSGITQPLKDIPQCFGQGVPVTADCSLYATCLNLNYNFEMKTATTANCGPDPGFEFHQKSIVIQDLTREKGFLCDGSGKAVGEKALVDETSTNNQVTIMLPQLAQDATPPPCMKGLDLGAQLTCGQLSLLAFQGSPATIPAFQDFVGFTCSVGPQ